MLNEYKKLKIDLGSIQYLSIAQRYTELVESVGGIPSIQMNENLKNIILFPEEFKEELTAATLDIYDSYTPLIKKDIGDLTSEEKSTVGWQAEDEEDFLDFKETLSSSPFRFPVHPTKGHLSKLAIIEWFKFMRYSSWDLWSAAAHFAAHLNTIEDGYRYSNNFEIGELLYTLKKVYDFTDLQIETIAGDFDT